MFLVSAGGSQSPQYDWLGLSHLAAPAGKDAAAEKQSAAAGKDSGRQSESSDVPTAGWTSSRIPQADKADSRRASLFDEKSSPEWLEMAADRSTEKRPPSAAGRKSFDWDGEDDSDWLGTKTSSAAEKADNSAADYLGLGSEIDLSHRPLRFRFLLSCHPCYQSFTLTCLCHQAV